MNLQGKLELHWKKCEKYLTKIGRKMKLLRVSALALIESEVHVTHSEFADPQHTRIESQEIGVSYKL
jgi:hypothetical protein